MTKLEFTLRTKPLSLRPLFDATINGVHTLCLFDTGARAAIYCRDKYRFEEWCDQIGGAVEVCEVEIGGLGKGLEKGTLYRIPYFKLSDGNNVINFQNFSVVHLPKDTIVCELLLPISIIRSMGCILDYTKKKPELSFHTKNTTFFTGYSVEANSLYTFDKSNKEYLNYMESLEDNS